MSLRDSRLEKWLRLDRDERRWLVQACLILPAVRLGLSVTSVRALSRLIARLSVRHGGARTARPARVVWAVEVVGARLPRASTCLSRALTAHLLLRREGVSSRVRLGVSRDEERRPHAHAWIEWGDAPMNPRDEGFSAFSLDLGAL